MIQGSVQVSGFEFMDTKELGRIHRGDPLGITDSRRRGMWEIKKPVDVFASIAQPASILNLPAMLLWKNKSSMRRNKNGILAMVVLPMKSREA